MCCFQTYPSIFFPLHSSSGTGTRLFKGRGEPTPGVPSAWQLLLFLLIAEGETCGNSNGCSRERERERESRINGRGRDRRSRADGHCMWRKRGVVIFSEIVILLMGVGVGGLVRTIPSSTYFFFYWRERKRVFFFRPNPSQRTQDCHGWENSGTNEALDLFQSRGNRS